MTGPPLPLHPRGDGDGWVRCDQGHRHWGLHGAAGLLVVTGSGPTPPPSVLLQHRADWTHHGGTWGVLGGARRRVESAEQAARREAAEEGGLDSDQVLVTGEFLDDHGGWAYTTVLATAEHPLPVAPTGLESAQVEWTAEPDVDDRPLHPGFAASWPLLREELEPVRVVVDGANVVGSRPDGWWRDRAGAAARLLARLAVLDGAGITADDLPLHTVLRHAWPRWELVLEGAARAAEPAGSGGRLSVVRAEGEGDDTIVARVSAGRPERTVVVTADRGLAERVRAAGGSVVGPRWLLELLDTAAAPEDP